MKTITKTMKWLMVILLGVTFIACKKEKDSEVAELFKQEILNKKIAEIIPKEYQDTLTKLGIVLNQETTPPTIEGAFAFKPVKLVKSNRPEDPANLAFLDVSIKFFSQDKDNNIKLITKNLLNDADTSIVTAISGNANKFTVYGKVKSIGGTNSAIFGVIISGEKDGSVLKNIRYGLINIDNSKGGTRFIKQGQARLIQDTDNVSETIPMF
jgi:hypothetical protein